MKESDIRKYAELMRELGLTGLEITDDNKTVRLEMAGRPSETVIVPSHQTVAPQTLEPSTDYISVRSPIVGVFYSSPTENAAPYVAVGDRVKKGQTLCIVEAMKLMNEIFAEEDGVISEICAANGQVVEFGTELFRIKK